MERERKPQILFHEDGLFLITFPTPGQIRIEDRKGEPYRTINDFHWSGMPASVVEAHALVFLDLPQHPSFA